MIYYECPKCGAAMASSEAMAGRAGTCSACGNVTVVPKSSPAGRAAGRDERIVLSVRPVMLKNHPVAFILLMILFPLGIILFPLWWLNCLGTLLTVTETRTILCRGIWSKGTNELRHRDIRTICVRQGILQRLFDVGDIGLSTAGQGDIEVVVRGVECPQDIAESIRCRQE